MEEESTKAASPRREAEDIVPPPPTKNSPHTATSVDEEVEILGSRKVIQTGPPTTLSKVPEVEMKDVKLKHGKGAVSLSELPDFKAMDFTSMMNEFLTRSTQHRVIEDTFVSSLQECYEVYLPPFPFHVSLHIYAVAPKL